MAAFQNLGGFISTFANPGETGLYFNDEGVLVAGNPDDFCDKKQGDNEEQDQENSEKKTEIDDRCPLAAQETMDIENDSDSTDSSTNIFCQNIDKSFEEIRASDNIQGQSIYANSNELNDIVSNPSKCKNVCDTSNTCNNNQEVSARDNTKGDISDEGFKSSNDSGVDLNSPVHANADSIKLSTNPEESSDFGSFQYWRTPLPEIDVDLDVDKTKEVVIETDENVENLQSAESGESLDDVTSKLSDLHLSSSEHSDDGSRKVIKQVENCIFDDSVKENNLEVEHKNESEREPDFSVYDFNEADESSETKLHVASFTEDGDPSEEVEHIGSTHVIGQNLNESTMTVVDGVVRALGGGPMSFSNDEFGRSKKYESTTEAITETYQQNVIPSALLEHYLSMIDPSRAQTVDTEITKHCAFSLPAVAYTLGRENWPCLRDLYETLAADMQWKVRRTLAFSLHELAVIVGDRITHDDLVPIFNGFTKDLDEVRVGLLKHLAEFLKLLKVEVREEYLTKIPEFLNTDNSRNWRFREELAEQLLVMLDLYSPQDIATHMVPIGMELAEDKVAVVRQAAFRVMSHMLKCLSGHNDDALVSQFINDIIEKFAESNKWTKRQMFAQICQRILADEAICQDRFAKELLPSLLRMGTDPVANVRISLAKCLAQNIVPTEYFTSYKNPHHEDLLSAVQQMQSDQDKDVRFFINQPPQTDVADMIPV